jgi:23S rRNA (uracil1939-C5)-methyltransferase
LEIKVERLVHRGLGLARREGKTIFIPGVIPGEVVLCEITENKPSYAHAWLKKVIQPSVHRREPECRYFLACGGCQLEHIDYKHQLELKKDVLIETLSRMAKFDPRPFVQEIIPSPSPLKYRARVRFHVSSGEVGFKAFESEKFVKVTDCLLARDEIRTAMPALQKLLKQLLSGKNFEVELDFDPDTKKVFALPTMGKRIAYSYEQGEFVGVELSKPALRRLSSFVQVNPEQNENLKKLAGELARSARAKSCLELFAGSGNLSFEMAGKVNHLTSVELNANAVELAKSLARERGITNIEFIAQTSESYLKHALTAGLKFDLVVLDPPRTGAKRESEKIAGLKPRNIIYVSCEPSTLARDLRILIDGGFHLEKIIPLDMFPQTFHIETISMLSA